ncbi:MAG: hypothetical protein H7256_03320 [Bdellovibrio sp.]|nr:hypothetical protein [Bdellovibrio sp.]
MRAGKELNLRIATEVFGYEVKPHNGELYEFRPQGNCPLRNYSTEMEYAWEVAAFMKVTLIPIVGDHWFAFIGSADNAGWESPQAVLEFLNAGVFSVAGAAVNINPCLAICTAAIKMVEKKKRLETALSELTPPPEIQLPENADVH